ncbi:Protein phosphatase 2C 6 [Exophiala xenobiotica]|uniref:Protein phosphatase 2C 6 n=1 Tax=Lithohypha guttulata TaxID=1690604 RepID=A0ABR0K0B6_9EURO|nr:Protein phosphatase 2C 6 [Lithohypha guttulata]KAK5310637.1 Protein phosphatase 2C 6 [Exophiala xenobiotica]
MSWLAANVEAAMFHGSRIKAERYAELLPQYIRQVSRDRPKIHPPTSSYTCGAQQRRHFHDYFVTHLPSSSLHPDSRTRGPAHKFDRKSSTPHTHTGTHRAAPAAHPSRDTTVVRIPLKSAKHHYGACVSRGSRPYNEDAHQAGVIELPAFAKRPPQSITSRRSAEAQGADSASGDPQVFYFGVFDGHGGAECSDYLREELHGYLERTASGFRLTSSLQSAGPKKVEPGSEEGDVKQAAKEALKSVNIVDEKDVPDKVAAGYTDGERPSYVESAPPVVQDAEQGNIRHLETQLVQNWKTLVGGYFRRFKPAYFSIYGDNTEAEKDPKGSSNVAAEGSVIEEVVTYAFLKADYDFVSAQAAKDTESKDNVRAEKPLNEDDILGTSQPTNKREQRSFKGGSTCSIAVVSSPSPTPFWNPATSSSMLVAHVGDTRILLCSTATGVGIPLTTDHHPSSPIEANRLRRYAATFVTDSFGQERISGLANTRAFGDVGSKRVGVSAEPEIRRVELGAAEYSFMVLVSDGVSGTLNDQEIVDIVKEAKTPEQAARNVVSFATEVSTEGDNATCLVVRLGGWERRQEGGYGSLGTKEARDYKRQEANDPRNRRQ